MSNALSLVAFYFTIISFLGGIFFNQVETWHGSVRAFLQTLSTFEDREEWKTARPQWLGLKAATPFWSFTVVGVLVTGLAILSLRVPIGRSIVDPLPFVYAPLWTAVLVYWLGGVARLWNGHTRLRKTGKKIDRGLAG